MAKPKTITVFIRMSVFPAWLWEVADADGVCFKRFKTDKALNKWLEKYQVPDDT